MKCSNHQSPKGCSWRSTFSTRFIPVPKGPPVVVSTSAVSVVSVGSGDTSLTAAHVESTGVSSSQTSYRNFEPIREFGEIKSRKLGF